MVYLVAMLKHLVRCQTLSIGWVESNVSVSSSKNNSRVITWLLSSPSVSLQLRVRRCGLVMETRFAKERDENCLFACWEGAQLVQGECFVFIEIAWKWSASGMWYPPLRFAALLLRHFPTCAKLKGCSVGVYLLTDFQDIEFVFFKIN